MNFDTGAAGSGSPRYGEFEISTPLRSFGRTVHNVFFEPTAFFRALASGAGDWLNPFLFVLACSVVQVPALALVLAVQVTTIYADGLTAASLFVTFILTALLAPVGAVLRLVLVSATSHVLLLMVEGFGTAGFKATFRAQAYTYGPVLLVAWIPLVNLVAALCAIYPYTVALSEFHRTSTGRTLIVAILSIVVGLFLYLALFAAFFGDPDLRLILAVILVLVLIGALMGLRVFVPTLALVSIFLFGLGPTLVAAALLFVLYIVLRVLAQ